MKSLAAGLLLLGVLRHYGWSSVPTEYQRFAWNISGSVVIVIFLWAVAYQWAATRLIALWWTLEELQVIACSMGRMLRFWEVKQGESQCSVLLGFDLGSLGLFLVALILVCQAVNLYSYRTKEKKP